MKSWQDMYDKTETVAIEEEEELWGGLESWWEMSGSEEKYLIDFHSFLLSYIVCT